MPCGTCKSNVSPTKKITCSSCNKYFHKHCSSNFIDDNIDLHKWTCSVCDKNLIIKKNVTTRKVDSSKSINNTIPEDFSLKLIREDISALMKKFESVSKSNTEIEKSIHFCSEKLDDYAEKMDLLFSKTKLLEDKVNELDLKFTYLQKELNVLKINKNKSEQELLANNITISGIPYTKNENIDEIIKVTADIIKVNLHKNDIVSNYRIKKVDKSDGKIIVKFNSKTIKESFLNGVKSLASSKHPLKSNQIHNSFPDKIVYVNHELSPMFRKIFWLTKQLSKEYNWKYVWANSNGVYLRKTDGDVPIKIQSIKDISGFDFENKLAHLKLHDLESSG